VTHLSQQQKQLVESANTSCDKTQKDLAILTGEVEAHQTEMEEKKLRITQCEKDVASLEARVKDYKEHVTRELRLHQLSKKLCLKSEKSIVLPTI